MAPTEQHVYILTLPPNACPSLDSEAMDKHTDRAWTLAVAYSRHIRAHALCPLLSEAVGGLATIVQGASE